mmetsp:Transcript_25326/g.57601  ORF Transcript_25326/g.57601 Transcript_25326/m.57601 type:complete len:241 (+) Transcript_25326:235-957(+)
MAAGALCDGMARGAEVPVARLADRYHLPRLHRSLALVAHARLCQAGAQGVVLRALRKWHRLLIVIPADGGTLGPAAPAQVPVALAAVHDHLLCADLAPAPIATAHALRHPALESVTCRALRYGAADPAHVPIALSAVHDHLALHCQLLTAITPALQLLRQLDHHQRVAVPALRHWITGRADVPVAAAAVRYHLVPSYRLPAAIALASNGKCELQRVASLAPRCGPDDLSSMGQMLTRGLR